MLPAGAASCGLKAHDGRAVMVGIRPESITDPDGADRNAETVAKEPCLVEVVEPAGSDTFVVTHLGGTEVIARMRADARVPVGQRVPFAFNMDKAVYFDPETQLRLA